MESNPGKVAIVIAIILGLIFGYYWAEGAKYSSEQKELQNMAECRSMGGEYAEGKCYVNGEKK